MLQAQSKDGNFITLANLKKSEIEFHRKVSKFFCPTCKQPVMIKSGSKTIPHFAHYPNTNCPANTYGEGPYHKKGKLLLYRWLKKQKLNVSLEKYIPKINQQPDLFLTINEKKIAIEYQCSKISAQEILTRNRGYLNAGIQPIWILGANLFRRKTAYHLRLDQFTLKFVHQFSSNHSSKIYYFCPNSLQIAIFQDLYMTKKSEAIGLFNFYKINELTFVDLFNNAPLSKNKLFSLWKLEKKKFRLNYRFQQYGTERKWQQWLYLQNTHIHYLPSVIFLPVSSQPLMKTSPWDWQSRICISILCHKKVGSTFSISECKYVVNKHFHHLNAFPLMKSFVNPINEYLNLLEKLNYIQKQTNDKYIITKEIKYHRHIEESLKYDIYLMDKLGTKY